MSGVKINAEAMFNHWHEMAAIEGAIFDALADETPHGDKLADTSSDWYDCSLELFYADVPADFTEPPELAALIRGWGFQRWWSNYEDGTEQYCGGPRKKSHREARQFQRKHRCPRCAPIPVPEERNAK